jgi:hypothetical protein
MRLYVHFCLCGGNSREFGNIELAFLFAPREQSTEVTIYSGGLEVEG